MYMYIVKDRERTQIYLTRAERASLERIQRQSGTTQSELIRRAIDEVYLGRHRLTQADRLRIARKSAGAWADRKETGAAYVERLRSGRLSRLHRRSPARVR